MAAAVILVDKETLGRCNIGEEAALRLSPARWLLAPGL
jgi:hypothetical protein